MCVPQERKDKGQKGTVPFWELPVPQNALEKKLMPVISKLTAEGVIESVEANVDLTKRVGCYYEADFLVVLPDGALVDVGCDDVLAHSSFKDLRKALALYFARISTVHLTSVEIADPSAAEEKLRSAFAEIGREGLLLPDATLQRNQRVLRPNIPNMPTYGLFMALSRSAGGNAYGVRVEIRELRRMRGQLVWSISGGAVGGSVSESLVFESETERRMVTLLSLAQISLWEGVPTCNLRVYSFGRKCETQQYLETVISAIVAANPGCALACCNLEFAFAVSQEKLGDPGDCYGFLCNLAVEAKALARDAARSDDDERAGKVEAAARFLNAADGGTTLAAPSGRPLSWSALKGDWAKRSGFGFVDGMRSSDAKALMIEEGLLSPYCDMPTAAGERLGVSVKYGHHGKYVAYGPLAAKKLLELVMEKRWQELGDGRGSSEADRGDCFAA